MLQLNAGNRAFVYRIILVVAILLDMQSATNHDAESFAPKRRSTEFKGRFSVTTRGSEFMPPQFLGPQSERAPEEQKFSRMNAQFTLMAFSVMVGIVSIGGLIGYFTSVSAVMS